MLPKVYHSLLAYPARVRRLARDDGRLLQTVAGLHVVAFAILRLQRAVFLLVEFVESLQQA